MKAEHRHELKTNDLAKSLITFQDYVKLYGGRVALGIAIVILITVLIIQRKNRAQTQTAFYRDELATARNIVESLSHTRSPEAERVPNMLRDVRDNASEKVVQAEALVTMGDYAWAMANFNDPNATSRPTTRPGEKSREEYLQDAKAAYQQVLDQFADQPFSVVAARFGLAAIAENERNFDAARAHYDAIKSASNVAKEFKAQADAMIRRLDAIRQPVLIGEVPEKMELPTLPTTASTTRSTTAPAATGTSTTKPATPAKTTKPAAKPK